MCLDNTENLMLENNNYYDYVSRLLIKIKRCVGSHCEFDQAKIDEYLKSFYIKLGVIQDAIDFKSRE